MSSAGRRRLPIYKVANRVPGCGDCGLTLKDAEGLAAHFQGEAHPFTACMAEMTAQGYDEETAKQICGAVKALVGGSKRALALAEAGVVARKAARRQRVVKLSRPLTVFTRQITIKHQVIEKRLVYGEVYAPNDLDTAAEFMTADEIEKMAHRFMLKQLTGNIDLMHDQVMHHGTAVVESFIARDGDPHFTPGAWVLGTKVFDDGIWDAIKSGELTGYSFQARVRKIPVTVDVKSDDTQEYAGQTNTANGHAHEYSVLLDTDGNVISGQTNLVNGHTHDIVENTRTTVTDGHRHTMSLSNAVLGDVSLDDSGEYVGP